MPPVIHVVSVVDVVHIDIVGPVPDRRPGFRAGINHTKPVAPELETRGTFDHYDGDVVHAKPVSTAKMGAEAIFRNAVSMIAAARVPGAMLTAPIVRALALPDVLPYIARSRPGPAHLVQLRRGMLAVRLMLRASLDCIMEFARLLVPMFRPIGVVVAVLRLSLVRAVVVNVTLLAVVITTFMISRPAVLCTGKHGCCQQESQYGRA